MLEQEVLPGCQGLQSSRIDRHMVLLAVKITEKVGGIVQEVYRPSYQTSSLRAKDNPRSSCSMVGGNLVSANVENENP